MTLLALEITMPRMPELLPDEDGDAYRRMARRYRELVARGRKRSLLAVMIAADEFGFDLGELRARNRKRPVALARQKAMAFAYFISGSSVRDVAGVMERKHSTVIHSVAKFETEILLALGGKYESRK